MLTMRSSKAAGTLVVLVVVLVGSAGHIGAQNIRVSSKTDPGEVERQNKITQEILARYLQKRLFPHLLPHKEVQAHRGPVGNTEDEFSQSHDVDEEGEGSERVSKYNYLDDDQGDEEEEDIDFQGECTSSNCIDEGTTSPSPNRWSMPLLKLGEKRYYLGIFFKANWYRASQYCRYHGMHLASIASQEENDKLERHIRDFGLGHEHFWTSGTDQAEEGTFFWMSTGRPITFTNWNTGEPNNFRYENGEEEHCLELWNRDGKGLKWNDSPCSFETFFVCEV